MQPYQKAYRILYIIWGVLIFWNLLITVGSTFSGTWAHTPQLIWDLLFLWFAVSIVGVVLMSLTIKGVSILKEYKSKLVVIIIMVCVSFFTTLPSFFSTQINNYIASWEASHCVKSGEHTVGGQSYSIPEYIYTCDNGDRVYKSDNPNDTKRLWDGGVKNTHFPYSFFY